jgi:DNA adenine methylase
MISYIGGKSKIGKWIVEYYPKDMEVYLETFGGMFWCFFNMDLKSYPNLKRVVYNDFNPLNYNLFQCVKNPSELQRALDDIPVQQYKINETDNSYRVRFEQYQNELYSSELKINYPDYHIASKYVYVLTQVFSGSKPETSKFIDLKGKYRSKYLAFRDKLSKPKWVEHFLKITDFENMDFEEVIKKYDSDKTYVYVDPPYWKTENYYSNHDFDRNDHERLANVLHKMNGKFSLSYYDFELLHEWFPQDKFRWEKKNFFKAAAAKKGVKQNFGEEVLILNY